MGGTVLSMGNSAVNRNIILKCIFKGCRPILNLKYVRKSAQRANELDLTFLMGLMLQDFGL